MKKLALLLAVLMLLGMLAACKKEQPAATTAAPVNPVFQLPGHAVEIALAPGWKAVAEDAMRFPNQTYLELTNGSAQLLASAYGPGDTVDPIPAEDIMLECNDRLFASMTELSEKEEQKSYSVSGKDILSVRYSAKEGGSAKEFYCFVVSFLDGSECQAWLCFVASSDYMGSNKDAFKGYAEAMTCSEGPYSPEDELEFDENGEPIGDEEDYVEDTESVNEETGSSDEGPEGTGDDESTETTGDGESTDTTGDEEPIDTTGEEESTEEETESVETTGEATSTATTN